MTVIARHDPRQTPMLEVLEQVPPAVSPEEDAKVRAYIANILPPGVPTYVRRVLSVRPFNEGTGFWGKAPGFEADVEVYDGGSATVRISGRLGEAGYSWKFPAGEEGFHWDAGRKAWRRLPKGWLAEQLAKAKAA